MKKTLGALVALLFPVLASTASAPLDLRLVYGSQVAGQVEPCG